MSLTKFTGNTNVISQLADIPVQTGDDLKAKFDEAETAIKNYLNNILTTEIEQLVATEKTTLQGLISSLSTSTTNSINELRTEENAMISDGYSTTQSYKIGDLCIYNNVLYRCTTAIDEGEAWNSSHWEQTSLGKVILEPEVYSTDEINTGKIWINEKPIYRKVISKNVSSFSNVLDIDLGISDVDVFTDAKTLIDTESFTAIDHTATSTSYNMARWVFNKSNNKVQIYNNLAGGITGTIYVIIEYTKTTD